MRIENPLMGDELEKYRNAAVQVAREAGEFIQSQAGKAHELEWHMLTNFKTETDKASDELIRARIMAYFPDHNIISEEGKPRMEGSDFTWVVDSLDGTIPWSSGINDWYAVCIGLARHKIPILGAVYAPRRNAMYVGVEGKGAFLNGRQISVSDNEDINRSLVGIDFGKINRNSGVDILNKLLLPDGIACNLSGGCASVPLCLVAEGKLHAYITASLEPWDMAAAIPILKEAGAKVTNLAGQDWTIDDTSVLAANPVLHQNIIEFLKKH